MRGRSARRHTRGTRVVAVRRARSFGKIRGLPEGEPSPKSQARGAGLPTALLPVSVRVARGPLRAPVSRKVHGRLQGGSGSRGAAAPRRLLTREAVTRRSVLWGRVRFTLRIQAKVLR